MSTVSLVRGSAWNSSQVHLPTRDPPSCKARVHLSSGVCGVGPALRTGKSSVTYWPGGTRFSSPLACRRPVKPLVVVIGASHGAASAGPPGGLKARHDGGSNATLPPSPCPD